MNGSLRYPMHGSPERGMYGVSFCLVFCVSLGHTILSTRAPQQGASPAHQTIRMAYLEVDNVTKRYSGHTALSGVSLQAHQGRIFGLLGPNGAGKSSLIRIINRITAPDSGEVRLEGHPITEQDLSSIGYLPEERGLYPKMMVGEQAVYLARLKGLSKAEAECRVRQWFERLEIMPWWKKRVEELSKGMQQKVQFITTVLHEPKLLIFDEPFSGFDPVNAELLKREILELKAQGTTLILSTHNMQSVEELCDDIALIHHSQVVLSGQTEAIRRAHGAHTARLVYDGALDLSLLHGLEILEHTEREHGGTLRLQLAPGDTLYSVVHQLPSSLQLQSIEQEYPSMHDIFLQTVQDPSLHHE